MGKHILVGQQQFDKLHSIQLYILYFQQLTDIHLVEELDGEHNNGLDVLHDLEIDQDSLIGIGM